MSDNTLSRRAVLGSAVSIALVPSLASRALGASDQVASLSARGGELLKGLPRYLHTATGLADGRILMVGGYHTPEHVRAKTTSMPSASVQIYDPLTDTWSDAASLACPRARHAATLLPDGRVAVSGGVNQVALSSIEVYDPRQDKWAPAAPLPMPLFDHAMTATRTQVIVSGGDAGTSALAIKLMRPTLFNAPEE